MGERKLCPNCGDTNTEFVQFGGEKSSTTKTSVEEVGDGILELRSCNDCGAGIENILKLSGQTLILSN